MTGAIRSKPCSTSVSFLFCLLARVGMAERDPWSLVLQNMKAHIRTTVLAMLSLLASRMLLAQADANPGRPTISTPATLTPVGYFQFETGVLGAERSGEFANRTALEETIKFTAAKRVQFIVQTEPAVLSDLGDRHARDPGGLALGLQVVLLPGEKHRPTISASYFRSVYGGAAPDLDIGSSRNSAVFLVSTDLGKFHVDNNYIFSEQINVTAHRAQFGQTLSVSHPVAGKLTMTGELWHFSQPFQQGNTVGLLVAPTYALRPNLVFDIGFNRGLTSTSTRWEAFIGVTYVLPKKLW
jgi:hypothetical protein